MKASDSILKCPVCGRGISEKKHSFICENGHCYDISAKNYVNLLCSQKSSDKRHGDDRAMAVARTEFLNKGYYKKLLGVLSEKCNGHIHGIIADIGCGECYYTENIYNSVDKCEMFGVDISKDVLSLAGRYVKGNNITLAVGSAFKIPILDSSCDIALSVFSPFSASEIARILKPDGIFLRAVPLPDHLWGLKEAVYEIPYKNKPFEKNVSGFELISETEIKYQIALDNPEDIRALFMMTPYYYKTSEHDQQKLFLRDKLSTPVEFSVLEYKKV